MISSNTKHRTIIGIALVALLAGCTTPAPTQQPAPQTENIQADRKSPQLRHVVLFSFKADADSMAVVAVEKAFIELPSKIAEIKDFEWGYNNSPENLNKGFTHCYFVTFDSEDGRAAYLPHPDHQAFVSLLDGLLEDVLVVDYWTR
ncbi:MAG: Dabb family protein [Cyclobacteriaceae bacterium]|nr:Dabb family protein [Cyclobacteriaceae bacterium]